MPKLLVGNWKMNGLQAGVSIAAQIAAAAPKAADKEVTLAICPPATSLAAMSIAVAGTGLATGGQDCHAKPSGAHTGDISAEMLKDAGASYVIIGHSERRADHHESNAMVRAKAEAALRAGLIPIICVGETRVQREAGEAEAVVIGQLSGSIPASLGASDGDAAGIVLAYEPVWAIGTGLVASPPEVESMHQAIHAFMAKSFGPTGAATPILYGGSVNGDNAGSLLKLNHVGGALVGGASLTVDGFLKILNAIA